MKKTDLILIGGFLGAGKTSMMKLLAEELKKEGKKVGIITNDQTTQLVDTYLLTGYGNTVHEVSGSCFCCNFAGFYDGIQVVEREGDVDIILAEPVGSCTDLSATVVQPLKDLYQNEIHLYPLSVLVAPKPLQGILNGEYATAYYIMTKQLDEADIILINKTDLLSETECVQLVEETKKRWPNTKVFPISVLENRGIDSWRAMLKEEGSVGTRLAQVDYDTYADGEAAYGWVNMQLVFDVSTASIDFAKQAQYLLNRLADAFDSHGVAVGHVKFLWQTQDMQWMGHLTGDVKTAMLRSEKGQFDGCMLTVNARVEMEPKPLTDIVYSIVDDVLSDCRIIGLDIHSLIPGRPNPTYHYEKVI